MSDRRPRAHIYTPRHCHACGGCGFLRFYDADCQYAYEECWPCEGETSLGAFVLRLQVAGRQVERTWHTYSLSVAVERGERFARLLAPILALWDVPAEVHVVYLPHDHSADPEVVAAVSVPTGTRLLAPARVRR